MCCYPLTDWMYRKQLEVIEALLKSLVYVRSDKDIATKLEQTTNFVNGKHWSTYIEFQGAYKDRLNVLRTEKREIPKEPGADRNMHYYAAHPAHVDRKLEIVTTFEKFRK